MATLAEYQSVMPTVFTISPSLSLTTINTRMSTIPAAPIPAPAPTPTTANLGNLFTEVYSKPTIQEAIAAAGGIRALASKHSMTRELCTTIISEFEAARVLYQS